MKILTWNIQCGLGCDGQIRLDRIIEEAKAFAADVLCLQEVARHFPEYCHAQQPDQLSAITEAFTDYVPFWGAAINWPGEGGSRREFGNLTLVRQPLALDGRIHTLPMPPAHGVKQMPRCAVEAIVQMPESTRSLRIMNTHLAFHSQAERRAQLGYLLDWEHSIRQWNEAPCAAAQGSYQFPPRPLASMLCGDLNLAETSDDYQWLLQQSFWLDAWHLLHPENTHAPTCGVHDADQWPEGPHCRDFALVSEALASWVKAIEVDVRTASSDHQPLLVTLA